MDLISVYMIERADGSYRRASRSQITDRHVFEGVDGDEETNTVTYWFRRATDDD